MKEIGFFRQIRLSWGFIFLTIVISVLYYAATSYIPGNTAELYVGAFTARAIIRVSLNYLLVLMLAVASSLTLLFAESRSVLALRNRIWEKMLNIPLSYYDTQKPNELISAVTSDTEAAISALLSVIISVPSLLFYLGMCLMQIHAYSPKLLCVVFFLFPVYLVYGVLMGRWQYHTGKNIQNRIGGLTGFLTERIRNLTLIKNFAKEQFEEAVGSEVSKQLYKAKLQYQCINGISTGYTMITDVIGNLAAILWGCVLLKKGEVDLETWMAFFLFVPMLNMIFRRLSFMWCSMKELQGRMLRLRRLLEAPQEEISKTQMTDINIESIIFEQVCFGYEENTDILDNISFEIPKGKITAITGGSGCGKTTVLRLIERLYEPDEGTIRNGTKSIDSFELKNWREKLSYVSQVPAVFGGTFRQYLTYGIERRVTEEELVYAAAQAEIYTFIMEQEAGFETELSIWGSNLSEGYRQRLVIARELLKGAELFLFDEPSSALDTETTERISRNIVENFAGKTMVITSHERSFLSVADQIIVLCRGKIAGCGTHRELLADCAEYRRLMERQSDQRGLQ